MENVDTDSLLTSECQSSSVSVRIGCDICKIPVSEKATKKKERKKEQTNGRKIVGNHRIDISDISDTDIMLGEVVLCKPLTSQFDVITFSAVGSKRRECFGTF